MNEQVVSRVRDEIAAATRGATLVRVYQLAPLRLALDLRTGEAARPLLLAAEPARPRVYLTRRAPRELEREQIAPQAFALASRKQIVGARLVSVTKDAGERVLRFLFRLRDELGSPRERTLVAQLTGRSSNLFLLDEDGRIIDRLRPARGAGQETGERYQPPRPVSASAAPARADELTSLVLAEGSRSPSAIIEEYDSRRERRERFRARIAAKTALARGELARRARLRRNLEDDLRQHGDPEAHKRTGDLILANLASAERAGTRLRLTDYFAADAPAIEIETDEHKPLQQIAAESFARYAKAKRAREEIAARLAALDRETEEALARVSELERISLDEDEAAFERLFGEQEATRGAPARPAPRARAPDHIPGTRRYRSSDAFEIVVGRGARENDQVTFRLARPNDLWLHAADYPGAHVVVRNHTRAEIPHRTVVEAAQLAAHYSQAKDDSKVSVNYTPRKFISKPKGAAPGLVRLAQFKTLLVEPREAGERITS